MPTNILQPNVSLSLVSADIAVDNAPQRVLIVGQKGVGSAVSGERYNITNNGDEDVLFAPNSHISLMIKAFKEIAPNVNLDAIGVDFNILGVAAVYTITITGTPTENGNIRVFIGSYKKSYVDVPVIVGQTATVIGQNIDSTLNDIGTPFGALNSGGVVTLTCAKGTIGNNFGIGVELSGLTPGQIQGISVVVAQTVTGSGDPTAITSSAIFDVVGNDRYQAIVWGFSTNLTIPMDFTEGRFNLNNRILDGVSFLNACDTYANCVAAVEEFNAKTAVVMADEKISSTTYIGPACREYLPNVLASIAAIRALRLTPDSAIGRFVTSRASGDQYGGPALASLPYFNTSIPRVGKTAPINGAGWTDTEIEGLFTAGASVIGQNAAGTNSLLGEIVTTYKTSLSGTNDPSWKFLNYVDTMSNVREYFFNNYKSTFGQSRLTDGDILRSRDMVNKARFEAYTDKLFGDLTGPGFVLCQSGEAALKFFKDNRKVTLDLATGTVYVDMLVPIVTQTRNIIGTIKIAFGTEG